MSSSSQPQVYLTREGTELILNYGPKAMWHHLHASLSSGGCHRIDGRTTAWALLDAGYAVTVVSEKWASLRTESPPRSRRIVGMAPGGVRKAHEPDLARQLEEMEHGVRMRMANFFFEQSIHKMSGQLEKMNEIAAVHDIQGFKHDPTLVKTHAVNQEAGVVDSYRHLAPVIDTDQYMGWLRSTVAAGEVWGSGIVNATGLGAYETAADHSVVPLRGALVRVINDGKRFPIVKEALCVSHDDTHGAEAEDIVFIVPRNDRTLILGGLVQPHVHTLDLTINSPEIVRMRDRCNKFVPGLENAELDPVPFVQGLRPFRDTNVRVDQEQRLKADGTRSRIIHSYGQGGSGFTLSFGCAADVLSLLAELEKSPYLERASL
ncbi:hypothetical protein BD779DRAFT_1678369 [Infundibulicybe gibba]|nr:hypothetical protein BD779DRAFT_1678369 [Infundibulicybe gibba]